MININRLFFPIIFIFYNILICQEYNYNGVQFYNEGKEYLKSPLKWNSNDAIILGAVALTTYGFMQIDDEVQNKIYQNNEDNKTFLLETGRVIGEPYFSPLVGTLILINGSVNNNNVNKRLGFEILQSFAYSGFTSGIIKVAFGRSRPYQNLGSRNYNPFSTFKDSELSLPSGHTTISFAFFTTLSLNTKNNILKVIYLAPAFLTGVSRVMQNKHWVSDVFLGAAIGYFTAKYVHNLHEKPQQLELAIPQQSNLISISLPIY